MAVGRGTKGFSINPVRSHMNLFWGDPETLSNNLFVIMGCDMYPVRKVVNNEGQCPTTESVPPLGPAQSKEFRQFVATPNQEWLTKKYFPNYSNPGAHHLVGLIYIYTAKMLS